MVVILPVRPLVPAVGLVLLADWLPTVGLPELTRPELLPAVTRPVEALLEVGRMPLIDPPLEVRPDTVAPFCGANPLEPRGRLIEPELPLLLRLTLAT